MREINSWIPLRIVGVGARSGYSSVAFGLRPFDVSTVPLDRVRVELVVERKPEFSALKIGTPEAASQIVSGIDNTDGWTGAEAVVMLKHPAGVDTLEATIYIPPQAPARTIWMYRDGKLLKEQTFTGPGAYRMTAQSPGGETVLISLRVDRVFSVPSDQRKLGVVLTSIGFAGQP